MNGIEYAIMMSDKVINKKYNEIISNGHITYIVNIHVVRKYEQYDSTTKTKYYKDYLVGKIIKRQKKKYWFGYKEEVVFELSKLYIESLNDTSYLMLLNVVKNQMKKYV